MASFRDRFRLLAVIPAIFSIVAFALQLCALLSNKEGVVGDMYMFAMNTSHVGENIVQFSTANKSTTATTSTSPTITPGPAQILGRDLFDSASSAFGGGISSLGEKASSVTSALGADATSLGSEVASAIISEATALLPSGFPLPSSNTSITSYLLDIAEFAAEAVLGSLLSTSSLEGLEAEAVQYVTDYLGIQDYYSFHMLWYCGGNYTSAPGSTPTNSTDGVRRGSSTDIPGNMTCSTYSGAVNKLATSNSSTIPSSVTVLNVTASVPLLEGTGSTLKTINSIMQALAVVIKIFHVGSLIGTAGTFLLSIAAFFLQQNYRIVKAVFLVSLVSSIFQTITAIIFSILLSIVVAIVDRLSDDISMYAEKGTSFLAVTWVAFVLALVSGLYWSVIWFIETRNTSFKRRYRTKSEHGNYMGIVKEVMSDLKKPVLGNKDEIEEGLLRGPESPTTASPEENLYMAETKQEVSLPGRV